MKGQANYNESMLHGVLQTLKGCHAHKSAEDSNRQVQVSHSNHLQITGTNHAKPRSDSAESRGQMPRQFKVTEVTKTCEAPVKERTEAKRSCLEYFKTLVLCAS